MATVYSNRSSGSVCAQGPGSELFLFFINRKSAPTNPGAKSQYKT